MKKVISLLLVLLLTVGLLAGCASKPADDNKEPAKVTDAPKEEAKLTKLTLIATPSPHAEIFELIREDLKKLGYELDLITVTDYVTENPAVAGGDAHANFFQHVPYLKGYNDSVDEKNKLVSVLYTHFEPMAIYAGTKDKIEDVAKGDKIAIPNDPTNMTRALLLLQDAGIIKLPEGTTLESVVTKEQVENLKEVEIIEANAEQLPGLRSDVAYAVINGNNAALAKLSPTKDGVFAEPKDSQAAKAYVNVIAVKPENEKADFVSALEKTVYTQKVYDLIVERGFVPTFTPADAKAE